MFNILTLNAISNIGLDALPRESFAVSDKLVSPDGIILRSFNMHDYEIPNSVLAVARAGAGTNNIPVDKCSDKGIVVFNTPGANANAVKELVLTALLISSRKIVDGINWAKTLKGTQNIEAAAEQGKKDFVGPEIYGKKLGVIGLGAIGVMVANTAKSLGMEVLGYDPFLSVDAAWSLSRSVTKAASMEAIVSECDYITIHIPLNDKTKYMFNDNLLNVTKPGARLINFSRGELVDNTSLKKAIEKGIISTYVTDFPGEEILNIDNTIVLPHIGASTPESEENCALMAAKELKHYLEYGNIKNSINYPDCIIPYDGKCRVAIAHKNIPNMVTAIATTFSEKEINIDNMLNKSKGGNAYTLIDVDDLMNKGSELINEISNIEGIVSARIVREA